MYKYLHFIYPFFILYFILQIYSWYTTHIFVIHNTIQDLTTLTQSYLIWEQEYQEILFKWIGIYNNNLY